MSRDKASEEGAEQPSDQKEPKRATRNAELVEKTIQAFENKLEKKNVTVAELVRLMELQRELDGDEPREIKITWVEPSETEPTSDK